MKNEILMENMSWATVEEAVRLGKDTVIIGVGSIEQHGPHLPLATDAKVAKGLCVRVAKKLRNALVAPVIRPGCSDHHREFPGTISLRPEVLIETIKDYCRCLTRHGFKKIVIIPTHGGNFAPTEIAARQIAMELKETKIVAYTDLGGFLKQFLSTAKKHGISSETAGAHAGEFETSLILALEPKMVDMNRAEKGFTEDVTPLLTKIMVDGIGVVTKNGVIGNPIGASIEMGETYLEEATDFLVDYFRKTLV